MRTDVIIIGGGVNGMAIAHHLLKAGVTVRLFEQQKLGQAASWAAGGMLAASMEAEAGEAELVKLCLESQQLWPEFAADIAEESGVDIGYRREGTIQVAANRDEVRRLQHLFSLQQQLQLPVSWLLPQQIQQKEPALSARLQGALYCGDDHQVDNRQLLLALIALLQHSTILLHENTKIERLITEAGRVCGVAAGNVEYRAAQVIVANGAWSKQLAGVSPTLLPPVRPVKGQMLLVQMPAHAMINHTIWGEGIYLIPRRDGRLLLGATVEEKGFDTSVTAGGMLTLLQHAFAVYPMLEDCVVLESWAGLRPGSRDDAPILGESSLPGLIFATGHHRNGILLAPITAWAITELVTQGKMPPIAEKFTIHRFHEGVSCQTSL